MHDAFVLIVDDDAEYGRLLARRIENDHPRLRCQVCSSSLEALDVLSPDYRLILVDLEMPDLDGAQFLEAAVEAGISRDRIVINSNHSADELHKRFNIGRCLAVVNKLDRDQQDALEMILSDIERKLDESL